MAIKNVVIAGATGNIGSAIIKALVDSQKFTVTALAREGSSATFPSTVKTVTVDYADAATLTSALQGQDAVVSALNHSAADQQRALLDAAVAAGVPRFIPSEYGSDTYNPRSAPLPLFAGKKAMQAYVADLAAAGKITYTVVINGPFLDWGMDNGFLGLDLKKRQLRAFDGGARVFSTTTLASVGRAVVGVLDHPAETRNRPVYVQDAALTMNHLLSLAKRALGGDGWTHVDAGSTAANEQACYEKLASGQKDVMVFVGFLMSAIFREGYGGHFQKLDNDLLGIEGLGDDEIVELIKKVAAQ